MNQKPKPRKPSDLQHPKGTRKAWNGDKRKPRSTRWNGAPDYEDPGFATRGGCRVVEGTRPPSGLKHPVGAPPLARDMEPLQPLFGASQPLTEATNEPFDLGALTAKQLRSLHDQDPGKK